MLFTTAIKEKLIHPFGIGLISLILALVYSIYATFRFSGDKLLNQYYYVVPIVVPFVIFLLNRAANFRQRKFTQWIIDLLVILTAMWRVIGDVPYVSGHTLFLTFCILTLDLNFGRILAAIIMLEVLCLKILIWNDWVTAITGIVLGTIAAIIYKGFSNFKRAEK